MIGFMAIINRASNTYQRSYLEDNEFNKSINENTTQVSLTTYIIVGFILLIMLSYVAILFRKNKSLQTKIIMKDKELRQSNKDLQTSKSELKILTDNVPNKKDLLEDNLDEEIIEELKNELKTEKKKVLELTNQLHNLNNIDNRVEHANRDKSETSVYLGYGKCLVENNSAYLLLNKKSDHQTPYKIRCHNNQYIFELDSDNMQALGNAMNFFDVYLKDFCESENVYMNTHSSFISSGSGFGVLEKDGEKFKVVTKLKIKFI